MEIEMMKEKIDINAITRKGIYSDKIDEFLRSDNKTMMFKCKNKNETQNCYTSVQQYNRKHNLNLCVCVRSTTVYAIKG